MNQAQVAIDQDLEKGENLPLLPLTITRPLPNLFKAVNSNDPHLETILQDLDCNQDVPEFFLDKTQTFQNLLSVACQPHVTTGTFRTVFNYIVNNNQETRFSFEKFSEPGWYYYEPIHLASYHLNVEKLRLIVNTPVSAKRLNAQSIFCENALHVLLQYGGKIESYNVLLSNGRERRVCHVITKELEEIVECAKILIDADVNHNDMWNETPLLIAVRYKLLGVIKLLLMSSYINLNTCKDLSSGKSARDLLKENQIYLDHLDRWNLTNSSPVEEVRTLFTYLKSGNEDMFLRYNKEDIVSFVNDTDGGEITMLQLCLIKGFTEYSKITQTFHKETDILKSPLVAFFCSRGFCRSVDHLLNNWADVMAPGPGGRNVMEMAVKLGYFPFLAMLLEHKNCPISIDYVIEILQKIDEGCFVEEGQTNRWYVLHLLISKLESSDKVGDLIYHLGQEHLNRFLNLYLAHNGSNNKYKENICQLLRMGATVIGKLKEMSYEILKAHLDECIDSGNNICYNSVVKDDNEKYSEIDALHALCLDYKKRELLNHPALIYLVHSKWLKCKKLFYLNLTLYFLFLLTLYPYVVFLETNTTNSVLTGLFLFFLTVQTAKELMQLALYWKRYFWDVFNYLEISANVMCYAILLTQNKLCMVGAILLCSCIFMLMLGQLPKFTKYMIIFSSTRYFLEYAAFYFIQFFSFAVCFFILLRPKDPDSNVFERIPMQLFDTLFFFIGQYDLDANSLGKFPIFGRCIVALFAFYMTIILNNLLVGLIVTDMDTIQRNGKLQRQIKAIRSVKRIEYFLEQFFKRVKWEWLRNYCDTTVFQPGTHKIMEISSCNLQAFDEDAKEWLSRIHENRVARKNVLWSLYDYIEDGVRGDPGR
ncbi:transient receptor potential cation channel protein painless-like isoform X2 [Euwallacea similis]|uniref:transient receptor potential cation channel protein painless-like isoform X2 n=1 Tax=Euwallacea similis TaxID=1736056 RepID=UPI00344BBF80